MYVCMYVCIGDMFIMTQIINKASEGIVALDVANRSKHGACDLHRPIWMRKKRTAKKVD